MERYILYAYVDGYDLDGFAGDLEPEFLRFVDGRRWLFRKAWFVSQRDNRAAKSGDLPRWDFGINLEIPDPKDAPDGWFSDVEAISNFLRTVSARIGREFVLGVADTQSADTWDIAFIDASPVNLDRIAKALGIAA